ncbi:MAG: lysophospholipid acyltransferase family protein [Nitrospirota bacterium]
MKHVLELLLFLAVAAPLAVLPLRASRKVGELLGLLLYALWGTRRRVGTENLRAALARGALEDSRSAEAICRENFRHMGRGAAELVKVFLGRGDALVRDVAVQGREHLERARQGGRGVILVTGHFSNWELLALSLSVRVMPIVGVARKQSNPYLDRLVMSTRKRYGSEMVYKRGALRRFLAVLHSGGAVGVVMDQAVFPDEGVLIDFLGAPAWTTRTPVALARRTGAALVPVFIVWDGAGYTIRIREEVPLLGEEAEDTRRLSAHIEQEIREHPAQWLWIHRRWKRAGTRPEPQANAVS